MMDNLYRLLQQCFVIPTPRLTEQNLPDQFGRVFIITGGTSGVGCALADTLYSRNGSVYIAGRSAEKAGVAMKRIKKSHPLSKGKIDFLDLNLADLSTIKASSEEFLLRESRLDVLVNSECSDHFSILYASNHSQMLGS